MDLLACIVLCSSLCSSHKWHSCFYIPLIWPCFWVEPLVRQSETEWDRVRQRETEWDWVRLRGQEVGGLVKIDFLGCDKWDIPSCIKFPYNTLLGSYPKSLCCAPVCWSRPCDSQLTTNIKHLETELGLDWRQPGAASQQWSWLHPSQLQKRTTPKVWQPGKPITVRWNVEAQPEKL